MTACPRTQGRELAVVHDSGRRLRIRGGVFGDPSLDLDYVKALAESLPGVENARINPGASSMIVRHQGGDRTRRELLALLDSLPGEAFVSEPDNGLGPDLLEVGTRVAAVAATPFLPRPMQAAMSWSLALPSLARAASSLVGGRLDTEVLDAGVKALALSRNDYFSANTVGALLSLSEYVEHATERKTNDLLKGLLTPQVESVRVLRGDVESRIAYAEAVIGDIVVCGPGEMVPVDGTVEKGEALVNMSSITGESVPVHYVPGQAIQSGGVVAEGKLFIEAAQVGSDTSMARITGYMEKSLRTASPRQKSSEKLADRLVPLTIGAGAALYALTGDAARAASVLTVDYSCAIKLSTPVAVRSAMYAAGRLGVLVKGARALEALAEVDAVVFDKTGTLTMGSMEVTDVMPCGFGDGPDALLALAAGAEEHYDHPVARAVVAEAGKRGLSLPAMSQVEFIVAHGVSAHVDGVRILVGSRHFIHDDEGVDCSEADDLAESLRSQGKSLLYVARKGRLAGLVALRDTLRPEARQTLRRLKDSGISRLVVLTGDHDSTARAIWDKLPEVDEMHSELAPEDKAEIIARLRGQGLRTAFVGDGVNDAPALLAADVGVSMPGGADLAREAARILLLRDDISALAQARAIALRYRASLRRCLAAAVGVNSALLALAGAGTIPAVVAATAHNGTTIAILAYAAMTNAGPPAHSPQIDPALHHRIEGPHQVVPPGTEMEPLPVR